MLYPIQFSIPASKFLPLTYDKSFAFSSLIPGNQQTYIYDDETTYMKQYGSSYYAITLKKAGFDTMRTLEIIAAGCVPYFVDVDKIPPHVMTYLPKVLIERAMQLPGVSYGTIQFDAFDKKAYYELRDEMYDWAKTHLTTKASAARVLTAMMPWWTSSTRVLYLSDHPYPDYLRCLTLIGLKQIVDCDDWIIVKHVYASDQTPQHKLYGKGFNYARVLPCDAPTHTAEEIQQRVRDKQYDIVIFGSVHRGLSLLPLVKEHYADHQIAFLCGEDIHDIKNTCIAAIPHKSFLFIRELF